MLSNNTASGSDDKLKMHCHLWMETAGSIVNCVFSDSSCGL